MSLYKQLDIQLIDQLADILRDLRQDDYIGEPEWQRRVDKLLAHIKAGDGYAEDYLQKPHNVHLLAHRALVADSVPLTQPCACCAVCDRYYTATKARNGTNGYPLLMSAVAAYCEGVGVQPWAGG